MNTSINRVTLDKHFSVSEQLMVEDVATLASLGVETIVCNRPDGENDNQTAMAEIESAALNAGLGFHAITFAAGEATATDEQALADVINTGRNIHAYCRTGNRSRQLWQRVQEGRFAQKDKMVDRSTYDVVIIGAGSGGIATAASLKKRSPALRIAIVDPAESHFYQPGWTLVGGGVFDATSTRRLTKQVIPDDCMWIKQAVVSFLPEQNGVCLSNGDIIHYDNLVVAPGLKLDWSSVEGLEDTLGKNGVTSNYRYDLAPYTWKLVQELNQGKAIFTQPAMPIKCAGAPQKALYLSASEWLKRGKLQDIDISFYNAGGVLFGVKEYVPALNSYMEKYGTNLCYSQNLVKVDGASKTAWFKDAEGKVLPTQFDMLHVCPSQIAPDFIRESPLSDDTGWLDVDPGTLQSRRFNNIWGVGDVMNTTNAKTMAAARKQAPVVAHNIMAVMAGRTTLAKYDGYGSCPLTVEHGKIVLAEFTYGGKVNPSFPTWFNDGTQPTSFAWFLKVKLLPSLYWQGMLKGREWLASPAV